MKRKRDVLLHKVGDEDLLVPLGSKIVDLNGFLILNATGSYVWEQLAEDRSVADLATVVSDRFDVDRDCALRDVQTFVDELTRFALLE